MSVAEEPREEPNAEAEALRAENAVLRTRIDTQEAALVGYDALLAGDQPPAVLQQLLPRGFDLVRKHATAQIPTPILRGAFPPPHQLKLEYTDAAYLQWLWSANGGRARAREYYASCPVTDRYQAPIEITSACRAQAEPGGTAPLHAGQNNLPRAGLSGLPNTWRWLVKAWRVELRNAPLLSNPQDALITFEYNGEKIYELPLDVALARQRLDVLVEMQEYLSYAVTMTPQRPLVVAPGAARLFSFFDVIELRR